MGTLKRLLIIDDDAAILDGLTTIFTAKGYEVTTRPSPMEIEHLLAQVQPDLLLMDIIMPPFNGCEVCKKLKKEGCTIPIVLFSASSYDHRLLKECNADEFIPKPFSVEKILERIEQLINR